MTTLVWDYLQEYENERADILDAVETVFSSGRLVLGDSVRGFEQEFAAYHGAGHCVGVDNGTNAIKLALQSLGVGPGTRSSPCPTPRHPPWWPSTRSAPPRSSSTWTRTPTSWTPTRWPPP
ncbi:hypothetical protein STENM327S_02572 [Streptomyces tendae]